MVATKRSRKRKVETAAAKAALERGLAEGSIIWEPTLGIYISLFPQQSIVRLKETP